MIVAHPHHVALSVRDFDSVVEWYCEKLGFTLELRWSDSIPGYDFAYLRLHDFRLEVVAGADPTPPPELAAPVQQWARAGFAHLCLLVESVDGALAKLSHDGIEPFADATNVPEIGARIAFLRDCENNIIELMQLSPEASRR